MKAVRYAVAAAAVALGTAGCHIPGTNTPPASPSSVPLSAAPPSSSTPAMTVPSTAPATMPPVTRAAAPREAAPSPVATHHPPRHCADLAASLGISSGTAGATYLTLRFTNTAKVTCTVTGYPGVALTTARSTATQVGESARRDLPGLVARHTLAPGGSVIALVKVADVGNFPAAQGHVVSTSYVQVYPPDNHGVQYLPASYQGTTVTSVDYLSVGPVVAA